MFGRKYTCDCCDKEGLKYEERKDVCTECFGKCCQDQPIEQRVKKLLPVEDLKKIEEIKEPIKEIAPEQYVTLPLKEENN